MTGLNSGAGKETGSSARRAQRRSPSPRFPVSLLTVVHCRRVAYRCPMAVPRAAGVPRGTRVPGASGRPRPERPELREPEDVSDPTAPRRVVDHTLQRRNALASLVLTATGASDHLDPHPHLIRAAKNHGVPAGEPCPWCRDRKSLVHLRYVYGDELGPYSGRLRTESELASLAYEHGFFRVYLVEVCPKCQWNHLVRSYVLGDGVPRRARRAPRDSPE